VLLKLVNWVTFSFFVVFVFFLPLLFPSISSFALSFLRALLCSFPLFPWCGWQYFSDSFCVSFNEGYYRLLKVCCVCAEREEEEGTSS